MIQMGRFTRLKDIHNVSQKNYSLKLPQTITCEG